jgi:alkylhydroperoxidase/carboxymuconolactone decarboxylase family protein YurZ
MPNPDALSRATAALEALLGKDYAAAVAARATTDKLGGKFTKFAFETCFSEVWARPGLSYQFRSIATIAILISLRQTDELKNHLRGALNLGFSSSELEELILHCSAYLGIPAGGTAMRALSEVVE